MELKMLKNYFKKDIKKMYLKGKKYNFEELEAKRLIKEKIAESEKRKKKTNEYSE